MLPARKVEADSGVLWLRNELFLQGVSLYICANADSLQIFDYMLVTLSQMYVQTEGCNFRLKTVGCSDDFTKLLITFCYENLLLKFLGLLLVAPSALHFLSLCANVIV